MERGWEEKKRKLGEGKKKKKKKTKKRKIKKEKVPSLLISPCVDR